MRVQSLGLKAIGPTPESAVFRKIRERYGHYARPLPANILDEGRIEVPIEAEIPVRIEDKLKERTRVAWISLGPVATATLAKTPLSLLTMPSSAAFCKMTRQKYQQVTQSVEADLVESAPSQFGQLTYSKFFLQTLGLLVSELEDNIEDGLAETDVRELVRKTQQHEFLLASQYAEVKPSDGGPRLVPTRKFVALRQKYDNSELFVRFLVGIIFAQNYDAITTRIRPLKSYVRSALAYYSASYEFGDLVGLPQIELERRYGDLYGSARRRVSAFRYKILPELCQFKVLRRTGKTIQGFESIFREFEKRAEGKVPVAIRLPVEA